MISSRKIANHRTLCLLLGVALSALPYTQAVAADSKSKQERIAQRRMQQMQQQFQQEKAALEQENAALKEQLEKGEAKLAAAQKALAKQRQETSSFQADISEKDSQLASKDTQLTACLRDAESAGIAARNELAANQQKLVETAQSLQQSEAINKQLNAEKTRLGIEIAEQKSEIHACQVKNANLVNMNREMASKYEKAELKGAERFTGLKGVEIENRFQDARDRADAEIYKPRR